MPDLYQARIPLWCPIKGLQVVALCSFLLVYEMLDWAIGDNPVAEYTSNDDKPYLNRTMEGWKTKVGIDVNEPCIGIGVWGDTAVYHTRDSVMLALWSVVTGAHTRSRHWFFACGKRQMCDCGCSGRCTMDAVWEVMRYCLVVMKTQVYPYFRHDGVPFEHSTLLGDSRRARWAGNRRVKARGGCIQKRADWAWHKCMIGLIGWQGEGIGSRVCFKCLAGKKRHSFRHFGLSATWRRTTQTHRAFMESARRDGRYVSAIFTWPGFELSYVSCDLMHCADLGITQYLEANVLLEVFEIKLHGVYSDPGPAMTDLNFFLHCCSRHIGQARPPVARLTFLQIKPKKGNPKMKTKAAETRNLLPVIEYLLTEYFPPEDEYEHIRLQCVQAMNNVYKELYSWDPVLSPARISEFGRKHCLLYGELQRRCLELPRRGVTTRWHIYPKHHQFLHIVEEQVYECDNPASNWCYFDENSIGLCSTLAEGCNPRFLHTALLRKYRC